MSPFGGDDTLVQYAACLFCGRPWNGHNSIPITLVGRVLPLFFFKVRGCLVSGWGWGRGNMVGILLMCFEGGRQVVGGGREMGREKGREWMEGWVRGGR